jgi:hypothetical protein
MRRRIFLPTLLLLLGTAAVPLLETKRVVGALTARAQESQFAVKFTAPARDGVKVGKELDVKGTADVPSGNHLWILVHRTKGFKTLWWPQGEGEIDPVSKAWEVRVVFGGSQDVGQDFEIAAITVDNQEHLKLQEYLENAMTSGKWLPIKMPPLTSAPQYRKVIKENHN